MLRPPTHAWRVHHYYEAPPTHVNAAFSFAVLARAITTLLTPSSLLSSACLLSPFPSSLLLLFTFSLCLSFPFHILSHLLCCWLVACLLAFGSFGEWVLKVRLLAGIEKSTCSLYLKTAGCHSSHENPQAAEWSRGSRSCRWPAGSPTHHLHVPEIRDKALAHGIIQLRD